MLQCSFRQRKELRFQWIEEHRELWNVNVLCEVLGVSRGGFYAWRDRPKSDRSRRQRELTDQMRAIHAERHKDSYGSPRMHKELIARGYEVCENTEAQLMKDQDLKSSTKKKFRHTTDSNHRHPVAQNVLDQQFQQEKPDQVWVSDKQLRPPTDEEGRRPKAVVACVRCGKRRAAASLRGGSDPRASGRSVIGSW